MGGVLCHLVVLGCCVRFLIAANVWYECAEKGEEHLRNDELFVVVKFSLRQARDRGATASRSSQSAPKGR
jgi:hypothetical protein